MPSGKGRESDRDFASVPEGRSQRQFHTPPRDERPKVPLGFRRWGWETQDRWGKAYLVWRAIRVATTPVVVVIALLAGLLTAWSSWNAWREIESAVQWREDAYADLERVRAGYSEAFVEDVIGRPASSAPVGESGYTTHTFALRDHWVETTTDANGTVVVMSVTSCDPRFQPGLNIGGTIITLQDRPIADALRADPEARDPTDEFTSGSRRIEYWPGATGSSPSMYLEWSGLGVSTASGNRAWFVGVHPNLCLGAAAQALLPTRQYAGPPIRAPGSVLEFRSRVAANTYVETFGIDPNFDSITGSHNFGDPDSDCRTKCASYLVNAFQLPPGATTGTTEVHESH